ERKKAEAERDLLLGREQRARAEAVTARRRLSLLASAGPILAASLDYKATLERITRLVVPDLADWCSVDIVDERGIPQQLAAVHSKPDKGELMREFQKHRQLTEGSPGTVATVLSTGRSILIPEIDDSLLVKSATSDEHLRALRNLELRSMMSVPLLARGRTLGALTFASSDPDRFYGQEDLELAENLAYRCAIAMDNARLYRDRDEISRTLQRSLLPPHLPEIPGVEVGTEYQPAGEANEVGGDFYDVIDTVRDGWICTIGDVRGKGAEAAAVMALVRYTIRAVTLSDDRPRHLLDTLNTAMIQQLHEGRFCTAACLRLEPHDDKPGIGLDISCAGHPAPLILRADGSLEEVVCPGKALGVFEDPNLGQIPLRLLPGDSILLYTDGVTEARSPDGAFFGEDRLRAILRDHQNKDATILAANIKQEVRAFQQDAPRDDLAIMVLRAVE
ncbi:MAG: PP2C family protein-serine/threonine phosphatase, partial [Rubrobacteraceae bacterium]